MTAGFDGYLSKPIEPELLARTAARVPQLTSAAMATVLVVDDQAPNRELVVTLLKYAGHAPLEAADGQQALAQVRAARPALVICDINQSRFAAPALSMRDFARRLSGNHYLVADEVVARSEYQHRARNAAAAYLMQSFGNFHNDVEAVLRSYFHHCALRMNCVDLALAFSFLANDCVSPHSGETVLSARQTKQVNALMATSGLYDEAGNFAYRV
eukprot:gene11519-14071_t